MYIRKILSSELAEKRDRDRAFEELAQKLLSNTHAIWGALGHAEFMALLNDVKLENAIMDAFASTADEDEQDLVALS